VVGVVDVGTDVLETVKAVHLPGGAKLGAEEGVDVVDTGVGSDVVGAVAGGLGVIFVAVGDGMVDLGVGADVLGSTENVLMVRKTWSSWGAPGGRFLGSNFCRLGGRQFPWKTNAMNPVGPCGSGGVRSEKSGSSIMAGVVVISGI
jgi:hypothetical protein